MGKNNMQENAPKRNTFFKRTKQSYIQKQSLKLNNSAKNRTQETENSKHLFAKSRWWLQRHNKKYKIDQWRDSQKKIILREYYKQTKNNGIPKNNTKKRVAESEVNIFGTRTTEDAENEGNLRVMDDETALLNHEESEEQRKKQYQSQKEKQVKMNEETCLKRGVTDQKYKQCKKEKIKNLQNKTNKFNRKNKKGQPIMKYRMEMLLEQIQKSAA